MKLRLKLLLLSILGLCLGVTFCSADPYISPNTTFSNVPIEGLFTFVGHCIRGSNNNCIRSLKYANGDFLVNGQDSMTTLQEICGIDSGTVLMNGFSNSCTFYAYPVEIPTCPSCPSSSILVSYNNDQSFETITCDGDQAITINGLSTFNSNTFTPIYKVYYNSGLSTTSNTTSNTYLDGTYLYTLSGSDNLFTPVIDCSEPELEFSGYMPTFEITGGIEDITESGNIFNNFAENSVKMSLSNIPSYIQYVIIFAILLFILGFIRKFKR